MGAEHDLVVIGGGAAGLSAARSARRRGARVLLVQAGPIGGECTFTGCVPSKALIAAAAAGQPFTTGMQTVRNAVEVIAATENDAVIAGEGIEVMHGRARFRAPTVVDVEGSRIQSARFVIATGSQPAVPAIEGLDAIDFLTNESVFELTTPPGSLAVLGGGAVGCELAQAFARFGVDVTIVEARDRLLAGEEPEASEVIGEACRSAGITVLTGRTVTRAEPRSQGLRLHFADGTALDADQLLVAVGRRGTTEGLGLEDVGVRVDKSYVVTDEHLATSVPGIWAVGDVNGRLQLTHAADEMGRVAAANALSRVRRRRRFDAAGIPRVTFTAPEVAHVGVTEAGAPAGARVAFLPMGDVDRAVVSGDTRGFVKLIAGPRPLLRQAGGGRILGATIVAERAGEMIAEPTLAIRTGMFAGRLAQTVHAYPTWSVAVQQAAAQLFFEIGGRRARPVQRPD